MMGGGILDERHDSGFSTLPEAEVNLLMKMVALKTGKTLNEMIKNVYQGKEEGADRAEDGDERPTGIAGRAYSGPYIDFSLMDFEGSWKTDEYSLFFQGSVSGRKPRPVRPGMFLETVAKVLGGICAGNVSETAARHLEWVHQTSLQILQDMAFESPIYNGKFDEVANMKDLFRDVPCTTGIEMAIGGCMVYLGINSSAD